MAPEAIAVVCNVLGFSWATLDNKLASCLILRVFFSFRWSLVFGTWKNTVSLDGKCSFKLCVNIYTQTYMYYRQIVNTIVAYNFFRILLSLLPYRSLPPPQRSLIPSFHPSDHLCPAIPLSTLSTLLSPSNVPLFLSCLHQLLQVMYSMLKI